MSDDGRFALVVIAMLGNVFSPRWAAARARGAPGTRSLDYCAVNVALHGPRANRWAMTEHARHRVSRSHDVLGIGRSSLAWEDGALVVHLDERSAPLGLPLRGTLRFHPHTEPAAAVALDHDGRHLWQPIAPAGRVEVHFREPHLRFVGHGYLDHNRGEEPLEERFDAWTWSRVGDPKGTTVAYDVTLRSGDVRACGMRFEGGRISRLETEEPRDRLPTTRFLLARDARRHGGRPLRHVRTLEDGPFYARSIVGVEGEDVLGVHETVSLRRFEQPWVRFLLPFRMRVA